VQRGRNRQGSHWPADRVALATFGEDATLDHSLCQLLDEQQDAIGAIVAFFAAPIEAGIVQSLARPAGNITGVSVDVGFGQWDKRIQFLQQVVPQLTRLWVLVPRATRDLWEAQAREGSRRSKITLVGPPLDQVWLGFAPAEPEARAPACSHVAVSDGQ